MCIITYSLKWVGYNCVSYPRSCSHYFNPPQHYLNSGNVSLCILVSYRLKWARKEDINSVVKSQLLTHISPNDYIFLYFSSTLCLDYFPRVLIVTVSLFKHCGLDNKICGQPQLTIITRVAQKINM